MDRLDYRLCHGAGSGRKGRDVVRRGGVEVGGLLVRDDNRQATAPANAKGVCASQEQSHDES